jgi:hypothetical protein
MNDLTEKKSPFWLAAAMLFAVSACSSSPDFDETEFGDDDFFMSDAGTDEVPFDDMDAPFAHSDVVYLEDESDNSWLDSRSDSKDSLGVNDNSWGKENDWGSGSGSSVGSSLNHQDYQVQSGDTLMKIAYETYGDVYKWRKLYEDNRDRIKDYRKLAAGTVLRLAPSEFPVSISRNGTSYLIRGGDTLGTISHDVYGTPRKWQRLWENNRQLIKNPDRIYAGFYLYYVMTEDDREEKQRLTSGGAMTDRRYPASQ